MNLEIGKFYRMRDGRKGGPLLPGEQWPVGPWFYKFGDNHFDATGYSCRSGNGVDNHPEDDLVAEWTDQPCGPVRTVTRKEVVPGTYGKVRVLAKATNDPFPSHAHVRIDDGQSSADELRAAAAILIEIADALDSPSLTEAGRTG